MFTLVNQAQQTQTCPRPDWLEMSEGGQIPSSLFLLHHH